MILTLPAKTKAPTASNTEPQTGTGTTLQMDSQLPAPDAVRAAVVNTTADTDPEPKPEELLPLHVEIRRSSLHQKDDHNTVMPRNSL